MLLFSTVLIKYSTGTQLKSIGFYITARNNNKIHIFRSERIRRPRFYNLHSEFLQFVYELSLNVNAIIESRIKYLVASPWINYTTVNHQVQLPLTYATINHRLKFRLSYCTILHPCIYQCPRYGYVFLFHILMNFYRANLFVTNVFLSALYFLITHSSSPLLSLYSNKCTFIYLTFSFNFLFHTTNGIFTFYIIRIFNPDSTILWKLFSTPITIKESDFLNFLLYIFTIVQEMSHFVYLFR